MFFTEEQNLAINYEGKNVLVSAGAGSGKTAVLSERVIRKLKNGVSIDNLLILTFTNAAAEEMKVRIRNKIKKYPELKKEYEKINSAYITTFDAFCLAVVRKYHYKKNLAKNIGISEESILSLKKDQILDDLFNHYYEYGDKDFTNLVKDYALKNDNEIKLFIKNTHESINLIYNKKGYLNDFVNNFFATKFIDKMIDEYLKIINKTINNLKKIVDDINFADEAYFSMLNFNSLFQTSKYEEIKVYSNIRLPNLPRYSSFQLKTLKEKLADELKILKDLCKYTSIDELKENYLSLKNNVLTIIRIVKEYDENLENVKSKEGLYDFLDIAKLAIDILRENEDIKLSYQNKFNEILIDEYQDTSDIQELFINLFSKNNIYMVGDIKQSIYRFRNANPNIFKFKFSDYQKEIKGKRIDLNKNFRSRKEVLNNINLIFNYLMDDFLGGANYRLEHNLIFGNIAYNDEGITNQDYNLEILNYNMEDVKNFTKEEIEIFIIAHDIKNKINQKSLIFDKDNKIKREIKYSDFAILMDRSKNFNLYKKIFGYLNIPLFIHKEESIKDSINVKIIKNILNLINKIYQKEFDVSFKYSFLSIGRSYLFDLTDGDLFDIQTNNLYYQTEIFQLCSSISLNLEEKNIYDILNEVLDKFNFYEKLIRIGDIKNHNIVLEYLLNLASSSSDIYSLDEFILFLEKVISGKEDIKYKLSKGNEGVTLMTIHGAKGLEFPVVYFSGLYEKFNLRELNGKFNFNKDFGIILPVKKECLENLFLKDILKDYYLKEEISEKIRLFYVALTRAKEKMIFVTSLSNDLDFTPEFGLIDYLDRQKYRSFRDILISINKPVLNYIKNVDIEEIGLTKKYNYLKAINIFDNINIKAGEKINVTELNINEDIENNTKLSLKQNVFFDSATKKKMELGTNIHHILEYLDFKNPNYENINSNYIDYINKFLNLEILKDHIQIYKEYEFIFYDNNEKFHGIIDLLIEKETEFIIIDYKLKNIKNNDYNNQLNGYKKYISSISNKKVLIYLYSFMDSYLEEVI